jgi:hypothetical protein
VDQFTKLNLPLHILINNAGVMAVPRHYVSSHLLMYHLFLRGSLLYTMSCIVITHFGGVGMWISCWCAAAKNNAPNVVVVSGVSTTPSTVGPAY